MDGQTFSSNLSWNTQNSNQDKLYINAVNCGNFLGYENDTNIEITTAGTESSYPINVIAHTTLLFNIDGDIQLPQNNLDNSDTTCRPNSI